MQEAGSEHFKSAGDPHLLCDICMTVSTGRYCTTTDTCDPQEGAQYSDVSSPERSHASRVSIVDDTDVDNQESGEISEDSLHESKRSLTQISPKTDVVVDPSEIEIPELYQWIADHSSFSVSPPYSTSKQSPIFFECQRRPTSVEPFPFYCSRLAIIVTPGKAAD